MHVVFSSFQLITAEKTSKNPGHRLIFMIQGRVIWLSPTRTAAWLFFCNFLVSPLFSALLSLFLTWVHPSSLPKRKKKQPRRCLAKLSTSTSVGVHSLPSPVLLRWPFPLMGGSSQSRAKWCVRVCVLNREAEGESEHLSIISSAPTAKRRPKVRLFSCHSVMIHEIHLPESAPGCFGLWAKCRMWMQFVCVCVFTKQICFSVEADVAYFSSQQS